MKSNLQPVIRKACNKITLYRHDIIDITLLGRNIIHRPCGKKLTFFMNFFRHETSTFFHPAGIINYKRDETTKIGTKQVQLG